MGCFLFIWFQGLSSPSVSGVGADLQGTQLVLLPSHLYLQMSRHPLQVPKTFGTQHFHTKIKESARSNVASAHKIYNFTSDDTSGLLINLDRSSWW